MVQSPPAGRSSQPPLIAAALKMHGIDGAAVPRGALKVARERCRDCRNTDECSVWLAGMSEPEEYRRFCPNAALFDALPNARAH
ncbi:MAG: hypothetical protein COW30_06120 [Rhodospirillales bacterium CG15_BIG_FIL_POST_REV_8_21_14_020_66_15]|nr:MAG: hypothetical protein COW30_06120 [Rhodospirillales bacterium CG15_BIG_FIL_POST_REV_8_21_14_020_66_15]